MTAAPRRPAPNRLRVLRAEYQIAQWEIAKRLGVSQSTYCLIELGRRAATHAERAKLAALFRTTPDVIFTD